jgi:CBS domain containing-hemolysin-like protein
MNLLVLYAALAIGVSFLCSLLEAALLSVPHSHLEMMRLSGSRIGKMLARMKADIDRPLAGILTLNTVAHTAGAAGVGAQAALVFGQAWVGVAGAVMTLLILVLSEIVPKTLGAVYCRRLAAFTVLSIRAIMVLTFPVLVLVEALHRTLRPHTTPGAMSRAELRAALRLGHRRGALEDEEYTVLDNLLALRQVRVKEIMTPRTVIFALPADQTVQEAGELHEALRFTRMPVCGENLDETIGYVTRTEIFQTAKRGEGQQRLRALAKKLQPIPELASAADALNLCLQKREHILLVVDEYGGTAGIVTLEDIVETLLGEEIVDETDPVTDMQDLARRRHLNRLRQAIEREADETPASSPGAAAVVKAKKAEARAEAEEASRSETRPRGPDDAPPTGG